MIAAITADKSHAHDNDLPSSWRLGRELLQTGHFKG